MSVKVIVESENLDAVLGFQILRRKPAPWERLDYSAIRPFFEKEFRQSCQVVAIVREGDAQTRARTSKFAHALHTSGVRVVFAERHAVLNSVCAPADREVVDHVVDDLIVRADSHIVVYGGHDFHAALPLRDQRERGARVFAFGFLEYVSSDLISIVEDVFDAENDMGAFRRPLPRMSLAA